MKYWEYRLGLIKRVQFLLLVLKTYTCWKKKSWRHNISLNCTRSIFENNSYFVPTETFSYIIKDRKMQVFFKKRIRLMRQSEVPMTQMETSNKLDILLNTKLNKVHKNLRVIGISFLTVIKPVDVCWYILRRTLYNIIYTSVWLLRIHLCKNYCYKPLMRNKRSDCENVLGIKIFWYIQCNSTMRTEQIQKVL